MYRLVMSLLFLILLNGNAGLAQQSAEDLAKAAANPIADLISLPIQNNIDLGLGQYDRTRNVLNVQPVVPLSGGKIITRTIFPFIWMPDVTAESGTFASGLSDVTFTAYYVRPNQGNTMVGIGPVVDLPAGGNKRGSGKWNAGPSFLMLTQPGGWTVGFLTNNVWSFAGDSDRDPVCRGLFQYFLVKQLGDGWYVNSAPIITVNWKSDSGQRWVVPFGAGAGKVARLGKLPVNTQVGAFFNAVKPDIGPDWQVRLQVQILLPTSLFGG
jgi:hypothetical protein